MFDFFPATLYDGSWNSRQSSGGVSGNISGVSGRAFAEYFEVAEYLTSTRCFNKIKVIKKNEARAKTCFSCKNIRIFCL